MSPYSYSTAAAAIYLGVSRGTIRSMVKKGHLKAKRLNGNLRFCKADLDAQMQDEQQVAA